MVSSLFTILQLNRGSYCITGKCVTPAGKMLKRHQNDIVI